ALVVYKVGGIILESTDSIFISMLINVLTVGLYANYKMIVNLFKNIGSQIMNSIIASVGNMNASSDAEKKEKVFFEILYLNGWFFGFTAAGICCFMSPLIEIWFGESYVIGVDAVIAASVYFYISNMHYPCFTYRTTAGLFVYGKYVPMAAAVCNIVLDYAMGKMWGLSGIIWSSIISRTVTYELIDPILIFKKVFHKSVRRYFFNYIAIMACVLLDGLISYKISSLIYVSGFLGLLVRVVVFSILYNALFLAVTYKTVAAQSIVSRIKQLLVKYRKKHIEEDNCDKR
ncbi:MAG: hypothetical protein Q4B70_18225, partial [Lachnospiraceae bacterium]|nr:hypothetical protein [Lachnospiraceae bacterium]